MDIDGGIVKRCDGGVGQFAAVDADVIHGAAEVVEGVEGLASDDELGSGGGEGVGGEAGHAARDFFLAVDVGFDPVVGFGIEAGDVIPSVDGEHRTAGLVLVSRGGVVGGADFKDHLGIVDVEFVSAVGAVLVAADFLVEGGVGEFDPGGHGDIAAEIGGGGAAAVHVGGGSIKKQGAGTLARGVGPGAVVEGAGVAVAGIVGGGGAGAFVESPLDGRNAHVVDAGDGAVIGVAIEGEIERSRGGGQRAIGIVLLKAPEGILHGVFGGVEGAVGLDQGGTGIGLDRAGEGQAHDDGGQDGGKENRQGHGGAGSAFAIQFFGTALHGALHLPAGSGRCLFFYEFRFMIWKVRRVGGAVVVAAMVISTLMSCGGVLICAAENAVTL